MHNYLAGGDIAVDGGETLIKLHMKLNSWPEKFKKLGMVIGEPAKNGDVLRVRLDTKPSKQWAEPVMDAWDDWAHSLGAYAPDYINYKLTSSLEGADAKALAAPAVTAEVPAA